MNADWLVPHPQTIVAHESTFPRPSAVAVTVAGDADATVRRDAARLREDLRAIVGLDAWDESRDGALPIRLSLDAEDLPAEGYRLEIGPDGIDAHAADADGLFYAAQTLLQVVAWAGADWPVWTIQDEPAFEVREIMLDLGRAPFSLPLLRRAVRMAARLKLNSIHLHLNDDHLNAIRYDHLPLGSENPWAFTPADLGALVAYARDWHVAIVPEVESWGHAGSVLHHYPHLLGGPGMWEGYSFGIGEELYDLLARMYDEIVPRLENSCEFHVGLDEATWAVLSTEPPERRDAHSPTSHVGRLHELLSRIGTKHGRNIHMRLWADHGGRPIPENLRENVTVAPWQYFQREREEIREKVGRFGQSSTPFLCGAGMSHAHMQGQYGATRHWCEAAEGVANCRGVDICLWGTNDLSGRLVGIFAGADFAWTPATPVWQGGKDDTSGELLHWLIMQNLKRWQRTFPAGREEALLADRGPEVYLGIYQTGPRAGKPVAPTCLLETPRSTDTLTR